MKKKILVPLTLFLLIVGLTNCSKDNEPKIVPCNESQLVTCSETPPQNEICFAAFNRWFYNKVNKKCEQIGYSGCSQKGFSTQQECEECKCK